MASIFETIKKALRLNKKIDVYILIKDANFITSSTFIRLLLPLSQPNVSQYLAVKVIDERQLTDLHKADICIIQRTALSSDASYIAVMNILKANKIPLIVDCDDGFKNIDRTHPEFLDQNKRSLILDKVIDQAALLWVSTDKLKKIYNVEPKTTIIKNALDARIWTTLGNSNQISDLEGPLKFVYMGTSTHDNDLDIVLPALEELHKKYASEFTLTIIGVTDREFKDTWIQRIAPENTQYPEFVKWFVKQGPFDVGLAPLYDSAFNENKSDIKCLDYLAVGAKPLVSDVLAYKEKELDLFITRVQNNEQAWFKKMEQLIVNKEKNRLENKVTIRKAHDYILNKRSIVSTAETLANDIKLHCQR